MKIIRVDRERLAELARLIADFRVGLRSYKGIESQPDIEAGMEEAHGFMTPVYKVFTVEDRGNLVGYIVCKIEDPCVWVEHIFVHKSYRRKGIATMLFTKAEEIAEDLGAETVFNYVHPNNEGMIAFLRSKGYTVLNLIEIRKPYKDEKLSTTIQVGKNSFDY